MQVLRHTTFTVTVSTTEIVAALKSAFPTSLDVQALDARIASIDVNGNSLTVTNIKKRSPANKTPEPEQPSAPISA